MEIAVLSLTKLFDSMSKLVSPGVPPERLKELSRLNPDKIYLENIRNVLGISSKKAHFICETAVRQGIFERWVEIRCPDGSVPAVAKTDAELPPIVHCWVQADGDEEEVKIESFALPRATFYRFIG